MVQTSIFKEEKNGPFNPFYFTDVIDVIPKTGPQPKKFGRGNSPTVQIRPGSRVKRLEKDFAKKISFFVVPADYIVSTPSRLLAEISGYAPASTPPNKVGEYLTCLSYYSIPCLCRLFHYI